MHIKTYNYIEICIGRRKKAIQLSRGQKPSMVCRIVRRPERLSRRCVMRGFRVGVTAQTSIIPAQTEQHLGCVAFG